jgi:hypothetical protein
MIWRNKRPKTQFEFYFILRFDCLYKPCLQRYTSLFVFVGILMTGIYVELWAICLLGTVIIMMMMSQNIPMKQYLNSKSINVGSVLILAILSTPYLYFGWKIQS